MRVLCVTNHSDRPESETILGLKRLGLDMHVFCPRTNPHFDRWVQAGIAVTEQKLNGRIHVGAIRRMRRYIVEHRIEILHLFNNRAVSNGILAAGGLGVKIIAYRGTCGNMSYLDPGSWMTYLHPRIDRIICVSEAVRRFFLKMKWLWLRFPADRPVTVYKGHDLGWYCEKPGDLSQFGIPADAFTVACISRFRPHKGIPVLIDAMRHLPAEMPIHLLLIGEMNAPALIKMIRKSPRADRIHLAGFRPDASALQAACQAAVLPALKREGLPKVVIEAMAYGIPPIVTDAGGSPELIENGISGIVVPPGRADHIAHAILHFYNHPAELKAMGEKARQRIAACFPIEATIEQTLRVYEGCLKPKGQGIRVRGIHLGRS